MCTMLCARLGFGLAWPIIGATVLPRHYTAKRYFRVPQQTELHLLLIARDKPPLSDLVTHGQAYHSSAKANE